MLECKVDNLTISLIFMRCNTVISDLMINGQIRDKEVRLIGEDGSQLGLCPQGKLIEKGWWAELDLVKISPKAKPPVCKIINYGKYKYELARKEKEAKKKQRLIVEGKEVRMSRTLYGKWSEYKNQPCQKVLSKGCPC